MLFLLVKNNSFNNLKYNIVRNLDGFSYPSSQTWWGTSKLIYRTVEEGSFFKDSNRRFMLARHVPVDSSLFFHDSWRRISTNPTFPTSRIKTNKSIHIYVQIYLDMHLDPWSLDGKGIDAERHVYASTGWKISRGFGRLIRRKMRRRRRGTDKKRGCTRDSTNRYRGFRFHPSPRSTLVVRMSVQVLLAGRR